MENQLTHTVSSFDKELKNISADINEMRNLIKSSIEIFVANIDSATKTTTQKAKEIDKKVNDLESNVQALSTNLIALRNPLAVDLRYLISAIKVVTVLERKGDMIESAIKKMATIDSAILISYKAELKEITDLDVEMLDLSVHGFINQDEKESNKVWRLEDKVDNLTDELFDKIKLDITKNPDKVDDYVSLMLISRNLERMGDYCTKIAKAANYVVTGERVTESDF